MNERILEIAKQVKLKFPSETDLSPIEKKFAEFLIRECAMVAGMPLMTGDTEVKPNMDYIHGFSAGREQAELDVIKHFGVEE